jgi:hypothetical protein
MGRRRETDTAPVRTELDPELTKALEEKRLQIRGVEEARQRTLEGLKQQLSQAQLTLTPMHPTVMVLQQRIDTLTPPPPELTRLKAEELALMAQIVPPKPAPAPSESSAPATMGLYAPQARGAGDAGSLAALPLIDSEKDGTLMLEESKLGSAIHGYQDAMARIDAAKVELEITGSAYKHRYTVVTPAMEPRKPKKATAQLIAVGSIVGGFLFSVLLASGLDLATGLVLESWQVKRKLKLAVLADFDSLS